jgi:glycosyltransferase involved in cell wall biosynthesis
VDGRQALIAGTPREFAEAVLKVVGNELLQMRLGSWARRLVEERHDWDPLLEHLTDLVEAAGARARRASHDKDAAAR